MTTVTKPGETFVELKGIVKNYRLGQTVVSALRGVSLQLHRGEFTAVIGASGSGKSTLLNMIGCIDDPDSGSIRFDGVEVTQLSDDAKSHLRNQKIGFTFQSFNLIPVLSVEENVELPLLINSTISIAERSERVASALADVGLSAFTKNRPDQLSGGQRQRVAIARALAGDPDLVLADEPTANLDSQNSAKIIDLMLELNTRRKVTFLFTTHDANLMNRVSRIVNIQDGVDPHMSAGKWKLALRNLSRNRRRNFATGAAIATGFAALIALGGFVNRTENHLRVYTVYLNRVGHINIYKEDGLDKFSTKPRQYSLDDADVVKIKQLVAGIDNVEIHGGQLIGAGIVGNGCRTVPFVAKGIDPQVDLQLRNHAEMRRWVPKLRDFARGSGLWNYDDQLGGIVMSTGLAKILGKTVVYDDLPKDQHPVVVVNCAASDAREKIGADTNVQLVAGSWTGMMAAQDAEVVATFVSAIPELANSAVETSLAQLQRLYDTTSVTYYSLWLKDPSQLKQTIAFIKERLATAGLKVDIYPWMDENVAPFYSGTMQFVYVMVTFITFVLAAVVILSIFNSATMTIIERSQEIGMMRSLGFTRRQIRQLFVMEMLLLAAFSIVTGGVVASLGIVLVNNLGVTYNPPGIVGGMILKLVPNVKIVVQSGLITLSLAVITTLLAVRKIVRTNISTLLLGSHH